MKKIRIILLLLPVFAIITCGLFADKQRKPKWFNGKRIVRTQSMIFNSSVDKIFPLLCPVKEYEWMASWKGTIVYTESGFAEEYIVFYHSVPLPFKKAYWTASEYIPEKKIQWVITVPGICLVVIDENMETIDGNRTKIDYKYTITGISKLGNKVIYKMFSEENLSNEMNRTKDEIEYYIKTGKMLDTKYDSKMFD